MEAMKEIRACLPNQKKEQGSISHQQWVFPVFFFRFLLITIIFQKLYIAPSLKACIPKYLFIENYPDGLAGILKEINGLTKLLNFDNENEDEVKFVVSCSDSRVSVFILYVFCSDHSQAKEVFAVIRSELWTATTKEILLKYGCFEAKDGGEKRTDPRVTTANGFSTSTCPVIDMRKFPIEKAKEANRKHKVEAWKVHLQEVTSRRTIVFFR